jgi:hypothetical protein
MWSLGGLPRARLSVWRRSPQSRLVGKMMRWYAHGEMGWTARLVPLTVDGLIYASPIVILDSARRKVPVP